jgi:hypothetical protein
MSATKVVCPHCCTHLRTSGPLPPGQRVLCQRCGRPFAVGAVPGGPAPPEDDFEIDLFDEECAAAPEARPAPEPRPARENLWVGIVFAVLLFGVGSALVLLPYLAVQADAPAGPAPAAKAPADEPFPPPPRPADDPPPPPPPPVRPESAPPPAPAARAPLPTPAPPPQLPAPAAPTPTPPAERQGWLPPAEQARVDGAIDRGVRYLQETQARGGTWVPGAPHHVGLAALPGLTLLECGVPADDGRVRKAARHVRAAVPQLRQTYDLALAVLFLDRLGRPQDRPILQTLALRLVAGQTPAGGWTYQCPALAADDELALLEALRQTRPRNPEASRALAQLPPALRDLPALQPPAVAQRLPDRDHSDNSNTQFAVLGLWAAARHDLPLERALALVAQRFRVSQGPAGGWDYRYAVRGKTLTPSMTAAGLLGLAVGHGLAVPADGPAVDPAVEKGFRALGRFVGDRPADLCFLWSLERVGVLYNRRTIGGEDWYRWGAAMLLDAQADDGSWAVGGYPGARPVTDTCFALLFLKRANLATDLTRKLEFFTEGKQLQGGR